MVSRLGEFCGTNPGKFIGCWSPLCDLAGKDVIWANSLHQRLVFVEFTAERTAERRFQIPPKDQQSEDLKTFSFFFPGQIVRYVAVDGFSSWINGMFSFQIPGKPR